MCRRRIGIDMSHVKYIPSGFFGMLFDWYETGVQIRLYSPQPNVRRMIWFNQFFAVATECFFDRPAEMERRHPELYDLLRTYYRQDPAARFAHVQKKPGHEH